MSLRRSMISSWLLLFSLGLPKVQADLRIHGTLELGEEWESMVYVSIISDLKDLYAISSATIVVWGPLDSLGNFDLRADYLPAEPHLYRIHVVKQGDPAATITIGGQEENFLFLIMEGGSEIKIVDQGSEFIWGDAHMIGGEANAQLNQVQSWVRAYELQREQGFSLGTQYLREALHHKLRQFADTTQHPLVGLYALYQTPFQRHSQEAPAYYQAWLARWKPPLSPYLRRFRQSLQLPPHAANWAWLSHLGLLLLGGGLGWGAHRWWQRRRQSMVEADQEAGYPQLSLQERTIFAYLREGKSTKEIAHTLSIEPTTVKSHIQRIYRKLNISSRREAVDYPLPD